MLLKSIVVFGACVLNAWCMCIAHHHSLHPFIVGVLTVGMLKRTARKQ